AGPFGPRPSCPSQFVSAHRLSACQIWIHSEATSAG
uniref:Chitin Binding Protein n=1 Tax=Iberis umbellata TaxID=226049 RepID=A0ABF7PQC2_9BRAS